MDAADTGVATHRLAAHPALSLLRPLPRSLVVAGAPTRGDRVAIDIARHAEIQLTDEAAVAASSIRARPACQSPAKTWAMPLKLIPVKRASGSLYFRASSIARSVNSIPSLIRVAISAPSAWKMAIRACNLDSGSVSSRRSARASQPPPIEPFRRRNA